MIQVWNRCLLSPAKQEDGEGTTSEHGAGGCLAQGLLELLMLHSFCKL